MVSLRSASENQTSRSSSPAKRRADEMESDKIAPMDLDDPRSESTSHQISTHTDTDDPALTSAETQMAEADPSVPSLDEQVETVYKEVTKTIEEEGFAGYVVSRAWLGRVVARTKFKDEMGPFEKSCLDGEIGPVDNSDIALEDDSNLKDEQDHDFVPLQKGLRMDTELHILPKVGWDKIISWYGLKAGQKPIIRYQHSISLDSGLKEWMFELYPPIFTLRKLQTSSDSNSQALGPDRPAPKILATRSLKYMDFLRIVKKRLDIPLTSKVNVAQILEIQSTTETPDIQVNHSLLSPPESRENSPTSAFPALSISAEDFKKLKETNQIELIEKKDESMNENYNGSISLELLGLRVDQTLIVEPIKGKSQGIDAIKKTGLKSLAVAKETASAPSSGRASPAGIMTRGRFRSQNRAKGTVGFTNLGNTCYMNSALQCMRACQELSLYFLSNAWETDLNYDNPLGYKGVIAKVYGDLLKNVSDNKTNTFAPRAFKNALSKHAPTFAGYGQQDSQEFMSFLVDGLHEDLNRIIKKPYTDNPESDDATVNDPEAIKDLGKKYQEIYQARNSSVITDLFSGSYKNKLVCPECHKISVNFDPFMLLTLQLPIEQHWQHPFTFVPVNGKPLRLEIDNSKGLSMKSLKDFVASRVEGASADRMVLTEIFQHKFYRTLENQMSLAEASIASRDDMVIYELENVPTARLSAPKRHSMLNIDPDEPDSAESDINAVLPIPMYHLDASGSSYSSNRFTLWPAMFSLTKDEASSYDEILRKCLIAVSNQTTKDIDEILIKHETDSNDSSPPDYTEVSMTSDAAKSGSDLQTESLDEDYVDVKMSTNEELNTSWREKGTPIPEALRSLFKVMYGKISDHAASSFSHAKAYHPLEDRFPKPPSSPEPSEDSENSAEAMEASEDETIEDITESNQDTESQISIADSEAEIPSFKPGSSRNKKNVRGKRGKQQKYGGKNRRQTPQATKKPVMTVHDPPPIPGDERLVRNGEQLFLEWNPTAFEYLFDRSDARDDSHIKVLEDVEMERRSKIRENRRKMGMSLEECFEETSKAEVLTEDNAWFCPRCKAPRLASKQLEIWTVPDILVIHLKRFSSGRGLRDKVDGKVDFPIEGLDLTGKVGVAEDKSLIYDLFAVDNHYGGLGGGHYTAFAKNFYDDEWYEFNGKFSHPIPWTYRF
jgi:ubiquitin carboxyl-terminal hydrolase 4/11/15